jgi:uncharacterized protein (TIGR02996 family)
MATTDYTASDPTRTVADAADLTWSSVRDVETIEMVVADGDGNVNVFNAQSGPTEDQFERLLAILSLTEEERAFVRAGLKDNAEWAVFADWLEERARHAEAEVLRRGSA